jgi:hypothetical protein
MKDWKERLVALTGRIEDWNGRYEEAFARLAKERGLTRWFRKPSEAELRAVADEARRSVGSEPLTELSELFDALCDHFLTSLPQERAEIRARIGDSPVIFDLFWSYVANTPERVTGPAAAEHLKRGLAAVAIDDFHARFDHVNEVLGKLWLAAARSGVDAKPIFAEVGKLANPGTSGGGNHMREHMSGLDETHYFRAQVAPMLKTARR